MRNCNPQAAWFDGEDNVVSILSTSPLHSEEYDYDATFSIEGVDMLCIFGGGKYPGINQEDDKEDTSVLSSRPMPTSNFAATGLAVVESITQVDQLPESEVNAVVDDDFSPTFEEQLENEMDDAGGTSVETLPPLTNSTCPPPPSGKGIHPADYLLYKGKWVHKVSICRLLFNEGFTAKSHD